MASPKNPLSIELAAIDGEPSDLQDGIFTAEPKIVGRDAAVLAKSGKKQVLKRRFGLLSMSSLALTNTISWEFVLISLLIGLTNGGPAGTIYGCILGWVGMLSVFICIGELSSIMPTAGGQYVWAAALASPRWKASFSYVTGWITVVTWIAAPTASAYTTATMILSLIEFLYPSFEATRWQGTLVMYGVLGVCVALNTIFGGLLPIIEMSFLIFHIIGFFGIVIPIANLGPAGDVHALFTTFNNGGGWSSTGLSFFVGLQGIAGVFIGSDCAVHMAEEVEKADVNTARAMIISLSINGAMSLVITVLLLYVAGPLDQILSAADQYPFIDILHRATNNRGAAAALTSLIIFMNFAACCSCIAAGSRMAWSFARDRGLPFSRHIRKVDRRLYIPMVAIGFVTVCACLVGLIQIGSSVALQTILAINIEGCFTSYLVVLLPLLWRRVRGTIAEPDKCLSPEEQLANDGLKWGPWRLKGWLGIANNLFAVCYLIVVLFFSFWPPTAEVDAATMNWSVLVLGAVSILSAAYYLLRARKRFKGPIIEIRPASGVYL